MTGPAADPFEQYRREFSPQALQDDGDPFEEYRKQFGALQLPPGPDVASGGPAAPQPEKSWQTRALEAGVGTGRAVIGAAKAAGEVAKGTLEFAGELQSINPLSPAGIASAVTKPIETGKKAVELGVGAVIAPAQMMYHGAKEAYDAQTAEQLGHGLAMLGLGALPLHGLEKTILKPKIKPTVTPEAAPTPPPPPAGATTESIAKREAELAQMGVETKQNAATKIAEQMKKKKARQVWENLTAARRKETFQGHGNIDYVKKWDDLRQEVKDAVIEQLAKEKIEEAAAEAPPSTTTPGAAPLEETPKAPSPGVAPVQGETAPPPPEKIVDLTGMGKGIADNLYQTLFEAHQKGEVKAAGVVDPVLVTAKKVGKTFATEAELRDWVQSGEYERAKAAPAARVTELEPSVEPQPTTAEPGNINLRFMDLPALREELKRVEVLRNEKRIQNQSAGEASVAGAKVEMEALDRHIEDLKNAMAEKLRQPPTQASLEKLTEAQPPEPDIAPAETPSAEAIEGTARELYAEQEFNFHGAAPEIPWNQLSDAEKRMWRKRALEDYEPKQSPGELADALVVNRLIEESAKAPPISGPAEMPAGTSEPTLSPRPTPAGELQGAPPELGSPPALGVEGRGTAEVQGKIEETGEVLDGLANSKQMTPEQYDQSVKKLGEIKTQAKQKNPTLGPTTRGSVKFPDTVGPNGEPLSLSGLNPDQLKMTLRSVASQMRSPEIMNIPGAREILTREFDRIQSYLDRLTGGMNGMGEGGFIRFGRGLDPVPRRDPETLTPSQKYFSEKIILNQALKTPLNWLKVIREGYQNVLAPSHSVDVAKRLYESAIGEKVKGHRDPRLLMEMMDGTNDISEMWLRGDGPRLPDGQGGSVPTGTPSLSQIVVEVAKGDVEALGWLWAARRALDVKKLTGKDIGIDLAHAAEIYKTSPDNLHAAVDLARQFNLDGAKLGNLSGLVSNEALAAFAQESSYGPIVRILNESKLFNKMAEEVGRGADPKALLGSQPFKKLKGGATDILNMVESTLQATSRIIRASKMNDFATSLVDMAVAQPELFKGMIERADHRTSKLIMADMTAKAKAIKTMFAEKGIDLSTERSLMWAELLSDNTIATEAGVLRVWRNGKPELWRVDKGLADSIRSMTPTEFNLMTKFLGGGEIAGRKWIGFSRPFRIGITGDPTFIAQALSIDQVQGWMNTQNGFRPVLDSFIGWYHVMKETPEFKAIQHAGGVEKGGYRNRTTLSDILQGPKAGPMSRAVRNIKEMHPLLALNELITPIRASARMGEAIRALGSGHSPVEAAWAGRELLGNYSLQGTSTTIRAMHHMSAFSGPALSVLEKTARTALRDNPKQWWTRGVISMAIPAMLLYAVNHDDDEIQQVSRTEDGKRWWFFRGPGGRIFKWRKNYLEGAFFANGVEAALETWKDQDPDAFGLWARSIKNEVLTNFLPVAGVVPYEVVNNQRGFFGGRGQIVSDQELQLDPAYQVGNAGTAERVVGKATGISPAIINHVIRGYTGYFGENAVRAVSAAIDWHNTDELPPLEDLPMTQRVVSRFPAASTKSIHEFYQTADEVGIAAHTLAEAERSHPADIPVMLEKYSTELQMTELFNDARKQIADLRRASEALDGFEDLGPKTKSEYRNSYLRQIIEIAEVANSIARAIKNQTPAAAAP